MIVHSFSIYLKEEKKLLFEIKRLLKIKETVKLNPLGFYYLEAEDKFSLKSIKEYFFKTMKSQKSLEYRL
jgi:hypothetical protein